MPLLGPVAFERILADEIGPDLQLRVDRLLGQVAPNWAGGAVEAVRPDETREAAERLHRPSTGEPHVWNSPR